MSPGADPGEMVSSMRTCSRIGGPGARLRSPWTDVTPSNCTQAQAYRPAPETITTWWASPYSTGGAVVFERAL